jgi:hypothetical protein
MTIEALSERGKPLLSMIEKALPGRNTSPGWNCPTAC